MKKLLFFLLCLTSIDLTPSHKGLSAADLGHVNTICTLIIYQHFAIKDLNLEPQSPIERALTEYIDQLDIQEFCSSLFDHNFAQLQAYAPATANSLLTSISSIKKVKPAKKQMLFAAVYQALPDMKQTFEEQEQQRLREESNSEKSQWCFVEKTPESESKKFQSAQKSQWLIAAKLNTADLWRAQCTPEMLTNLQREHKEMQERLHKKSQKAKASACNPTTKESTNSSEETWRCTLM